MSRQFYEKDARTYDEDRWETSAGRYINMTQKEIVLQKAKWHGKKVLEIGAGTGRFSMEVGSRGGTVFALDLAFSMLTTIRAKSNNQSDIKLLQANAENLPFQSDAFDICICINTFSHMPSCDVVMNEVHRVLKQDGLFIFNFPNLFSVYFPFGLIVNIKKRSLQKGVYTRWYKPREFTRAYRRNCFKLQNTQGEVHFPTRTASFIVPILSFLDKAFRKSILKYVSPVIFYTLRK